MKILKILSPFLIVLLAVLAVTFYPKNTSESHGVSSVTMDLKPTVVVVENDSFDGAAHEFAFPVDVDNKRQTIEDMTILAGEWKLTFEGERIYTEDTNAKLSFKLSDPSKPIGFLASPRSGVIKISANGQYYSLDLKQNIYDWLPYSVSQSQH